MNIAFLGYGTVGKALRILLERQREVLRYEHAIECEITGLSTRHTGWLADPGGLDPDAPTGERYADITSWLRGSECEVLFETITLDPHAGQPALDYLRTALSMGIHVVSANKGPVVHGYRELSALAERNECGYRFESAVMDGAPVFSLVRECLPHAELRAIRGVFTSTATVILESIERGNSLEDGIAEAQRMGIAEADPSYDVDGWDSAMKLCALGNVLLGGSLRPADTQRTGIRDLPVADVRAAAANGAPLRLVGEVRRSGTGLMASVRPVACSSDDVLGVVRGATLVTHFEADMFPGGLTLTSRDPDATTTAYGLFTDFLNLVR